MLLIRGDGLEQAENIRKFLNATASSDLTLVTKDGSLFAHRLIILANIPTFKNFLCQRCTENHENSTVIIDGWETEIVEEALKNLYSYGVSAGLECIFGLRKDTIDNLKDVKNYDLLNDENAQTEIPNKQADTQHTALPPLFESSIDEHPNNYDAFATKEFFSNIKNFENDDLLDDDAQTEIPSKKTCTQHTDNLPTLIKSSLDEHDDNYDAFANKEFFDESMDDLLQSKVLFHQGHRLEIIERLTRTTNKKVLSLYLNFENKYKLKRRNRNNGSIFYFQCTDSNCLSSISLQRVALSELDGRASYNCTFFKNSHTHPNKPIEYIAKDLAVKHFENYYRDKLHEEEFTKDCGEILNRFQEAYLPTVPASLKDVVKANFTIDHVRSLLINLRKTSGISGPRLSNSEYGRDV